MEVERGAEYFDYLAGFSPFASLSRFDELEYATVQTKLLGKIQEGGISPLLGRFKGDCKGGAPARTQRSGSCGKRRNNGTDEISRLRGSEGGEVWADATPPLPFSFYRQRLFLCRAKKKGLNRSPRPSGAVLRTPCAKKPPVSSGCGSPSLWRG